MTNPDIQQALKWVDYITTAPNLSGSHVDEARAAARVIKSLPDHWINVKEVREVVNSQLSNYVQGTVGHSVAEDFACKLQSLLDPPLPTLAELIEAGNDPKQYQLMQCKESHFPTGGTGAWGVILSSDEVSSLILERNGAVVTWRNSLVTPLQGEPKMEWPGDGVVDAEIVEDDEPVMMPRPEDVHGGEVWLIRYEGKEYESFKAGGGNDPQPWIIRLKDKDDYWWLYNNEVTLVSRMVPEVTP